MNGLWQELLVAMAVAGALAVVVGRAWRALRRPADSSCGGCATCPTDNSRPLVQITPVQPSATPPAAQSRPA